MTTPHRPWCSVSPSFLHHLSPPLACSYFGVGTCKEPSLTSAFGCTVSSFLCTLRNSCAAQLLELSSQGIPTLPSAWTAGKRRHALRDAGDHTPEAAGVFYHVTNPGVPSSREGHWFKWPRYWRPLSQDPLREARKRCPGQGGEGSPWGKDSAQLRSDQKQSLRLGKDLWRWWDSVQGTGLGALEQETKSSYVGGGREGKG